MFIHSFGQARNLEVILDFSYFFLASWPIHCQVQLILPSISLEYTYTFPSPPPPPPRFMLLSACTWITATAVLLVYQLHLTPVKLLYALQPEWFFRNANLIMMSLYPLYILLISFCLLLLNMASPLSTPLFFPPAFKPLHLCLAVHGL